jgi:hypothetical protein
MDGGRGVGVGVGAGAFGEDPPQPAARQVIGTISRAKQARSAGHRRTMFYLWNGPGLTSALLMRRR